MIKEIEGNLLDCPDGINVIAHQANCFHTFGSGVARAIAERYPEAAEADKEDSTFGDTNKLGTFTVAKTESGLRIVNIYGQFDTSREVRQTDYEALFIGLERLKETMESSTSSTKFVLGLPYGMGCGLGRASWRVIRTMIEVIFENSLIEVRIVKLPGTEENKS